MTQFPHSLFSFNGLSPALHASSFVAPGARLIGEVRLGPLASVWFNAVLRGDVAGIEVGEGSNIQDLTTVHVEGEDERGPGSPRMGVRIGRFTTVGRACHRSASRHGAWLLLPGAGGLPDGSRRAELGAYIFNVQAPFRRLNQRLRGRSLGA